MEFRDWLLLLNIAFPFILIWMFRVERHLGRIEGYCKGRTRCEDKEQE